ncbi:hypothetical protein, partial [Sphingosinithalassobacter portus]|uniref:hypothetical protein n=1 Tax=Stakelama portus TaxID=2676234 RepID=UPI00137B1A9E
DAAAFAADAADAAAFAAAFAADFAADLAADATAELLWRVISDEADLLERAAEPDARSLLKTPLWMGVEVPLRFVEARRQFATRLFDSDPNARFWTGWYDRRLEASPNSFGLPLDADDAILLRIATADKAFWDRDPGDVNAEIARWVVDAQEDSFGPEPQNPLSPVFSINSDGRFDLDLSAGNDEISRDPEAADRHAEVREALTRAISACSGNSAAQTRGALERYGDALGSSIDELRPGQLIARGDALRRELAIREASDPDSNLPPIQDTALLALGDIVATHNLLVGLDPALSKRDEARFGPETVEAQVSPDQAIEIVEWFKQADELTESAEDAVRTAADLAPNQPDPNNRRSRQLTETVRNLGRAFVAALNVIRRSPASSGMVATIGTATINAGTAAGTLGIVAATTAGAATAVATTLVCHRLGHIALKNEDWVRRSFGWNETMRRALDRIFADLHNGPFK